MAKDNGLGVALDNLDDPALRRAKRRWHPTHTRTLLGLINEELARDPSPVRNVEGLFIVEVQRKGDFVERWFLLFQGKYAPPYIGEMRPKIPAYFKHAKNGGSGGIKRSYPLAAIEVEDDDLLNLVTGGTSGFAAFSKGRLRIAGDLLLAQQLEDVFTRSHGQEKALAYLQRLQQERKAAQKQRGEAPSASSAVKPAVAAGRDADDDVAAATEGAAESLFQTKAKL